MLCDYGLYSLVAPEEFPGTVRVFDYDWTTRQTVEREQVHALNAYLLDQLNILVTKRLNSKPPLCSRFLMQISGQCLWTMATCSLSGGLPRICHDPVAALYLRPFVGADELLKGQKRWCLWLEYALENCFKSGTGARAGEKSCLSFHS